MGEDNENCISLPLADFKLCRFPVINHNPKYNNIKWVMNSSSELSLHGWFGEFPKLAGSVRVTAVLGSVPWDFVVWLTSHM